MDVITTHLNADFDCIGSMVAAKKLYPEALLVFSGAQEKSVRDFFQKGHPQDLEFARIKEIDFSAITRLIVVDCQHSSRIGKFGELAKSGSVELHIYDHHPTSSGDMEPTGGVIRPCGSTTTILAGMLIERDVQVTPFEATVMMLGIHEDTGNLTFPSSTAEDYTVAAWLLERGAYLNEVADSIGRELTVEQVSLLNDLLVSLKTTTLKGVDVSIAHASVDRYIGDIATLAHMIRDMENLQALFLVVGMEDRVFVIARSRVPEVRVGEILHELGGGGHATAASATVRGLTLIQVLERLDAVLRRRVDPRRVARDIMSSPVKTISPDCSIEEARERLVRYNVSAMPVISEEGVLGIISRKTVEKALYHNLNQVPVSDYMHSEFHVASPDTPITEIQSYMVGGDARLVPVVSELGLIGVITRTDLLRYSLGGEALYDLSRDALQVKSREVEALMNKHLPQRTTVILHDLGRVGDQLDLTVYAVGGFVRDLLLDIQNMDIDVTVDGDGILFAETFASQFGCRVKSHQKFGTAVIVFPDGFKIDVASTRLEYYVSPGALPTVERSSLKMDLYRRDFTVNTLAIALNGDSFGKLIDYFGAYRDLQSRVIRVLHNLSFVEDPTRVFRAIRFEQRLNFKIAKHTEDLIKNAVKMEFLEKLGGRRLLAELVQILREKEPLKGVGRMASLGLLRFIHPGVELTPAMQVALEETRYVVSWFDLLYLERPYESWSVYFLTLCEGLTEEQFWGTCTRLAVAEHYKERLVEMRRQSEELIGNLERKLARSEKVDNSEIYFTLRGLPVEVLLYHMAKSRSAEVKRCISLYFTKLDGMHPQIGGEDLKELGVEPGPLYRELLDLVLSARLNGKVASREDEIQLVREVLEGV
ncbi:adenosine-specific tRNA nucleotidyltransferase [Citrifermentans bemidjiense Bem]|uniref:Adenosine-specific tRNA nucleotidyltransferase n=1 Tax=Citrifermentans bemidjiense (strain ATCC BAA-1014 / DSM 16622 / JCM 12645 / Bem) TaxID=404380 RepID=B5EEG1_CITBB|nr:A-adding tRNA nucleotidyltransferase [Citrifermentans bemidjiense]ACH39306.1 adenosine-specific tRNA nucleotidyltransferase [Citrifermentans bemidjiense Bem]